MNGGGLQISGSLFHNPQAMFFFVSRGRNNQLLGSRGGVETQQNFGSLGSGKRTSIRTRTGKEVSEAQDQDNRTTLNC
jgi:hypothetical protein